MCRIVAQLHRRPALGSADAPIRLRQDFQRAPQPGAGPKAAVGCVVSCPLPASIPSRSLRGRTIDPPSLQLGNGVWLGTAAHAGASEQPLLKLLASCALRQKKDSVSADGESLVALPPLTAEEVLVQPSGADLAAYTELHESVKNRVAFLDRGGALGMRSQALKGLLLKLRSQCCTYASNPRMPCAWPNRSLVPRPPALAETACTIGAAVACDHSSLARQFMSRLREEQDKARQAASEADVKTCTIQEYLGQAKKQKWSAQKTKVRKEERTATLPPTSRLPLASSDGPHFARVSCSGWTSCSRRTWLRARSRHA